jgi:hypothetical protein
MAFGIRLCTRSGMTLNTRLLLIMACGMKVFTRSCAVTKFGLRLGNKSCLIMDFFFERCEYHHHPTKECYVDFCVTLCSVTVTGDLLP